MNVCHIMFISLDMRRTQYANFVSILGRGLAVRDGQAAHVCRICNHNSQCDRDEVMTLHSDLFQDANVAR